MGKESKLIAIKLLHTLIWVFFNVVVFYLLYAALTGSITIWVWLGIGSVVLEGLVLLVFKNVCPLTIVARKYSSSQRHNFDIYLPEWLAKYNKHIYTPLFLIAVAGVVWRVLG